MKRGVWTAAAAVAVIAVPAEAPPPPEAVIRRPHRCWVISIGENESAPNHPH